MSTRLASSSHLVLPGTCVSNDVLGIFWDMENVPVSCGISPTHIFRIMRDEFGSRNKGLDFNVFCNVFHAEEEIISELLKENVTVVNVQKNRSKDKLRFMLKRFLNMREFHCLEVVLISDDIGLLAVIQAMVHAFAVYVILVGNRPSDEASTFSFCTRTSFSAFVRGLLRGRLHLTKQAFLPVKHIGGPYEFLSFGVIEIADVRPIYEEEISELSSEEDEGTSDPDTSNKQQWNYKSAVTTEECDAEIEVLPDYTEQLTSTYEKMQMDDDQAKGRGHTRQIFSSMHLSSLRDSTSSGTKASNLVKDHQAKHTSSKGHDPLFSDVGDNNKRPVLSIDDSTRLYEYPIKECDQTFSDPLSSHQAAERYCLADTGQDVKSKLVNILRKRNVALLVSNPGSGSGLEAASCAQELGHRVLSIQPTDTEARLCATYSESCRKLKNVDCWIFRGQRVNPQATVVFTTASYFFQLFQSTGEGATGFQTIIVEGINEDNIYQRVIMKVLQRYLQSDVTLIFCCRGTDIPFSLQEEFYVEADNILNCDDVSFPVQLIWKEPSKDKLCTCIEAILEYCATESCDGDIVVFVPTVEDAFEAKASLEIRLLREGRQESFICEVMYAGMVPLGTIQASSYKIWKVYFTVDCPDVSASVMRIRCIVDCGFVSTTSFESGVFIREFRPICPAEADERQSLAAFHGKGTCYRVYSERELLSSLPSAGNNMLYMEDVVLRLLAGKTEASAFLQHEVPKQVLREAKCGLREIGAIDKNGQVTEVGHTLCLLSLEPRLGKLILVSLGRLLTQDAVLLSTVAFEDWRSAYKSLREECGQSVAPVSKGSCQFSHLIILYKEWCAQPKKERSTWCTVNMLNDLFFEHWHGKATCAYSEVLNFRTGNLIDRPSVQPKYGVVTIANVLSECFPNGLLQVTEQGCQHPTFGKDIKVSSFSSLGRELQTNGTAICWLFSRDPGNKVLQVLNACILPGSRNGSEVWHFNYGAERIYVRQKVVPIGSPIWEGQFSDVHIAQFLEKQLGSTFDMRKSEGSLVSDVARERVLLVGTSHYCCTVGVFLQRAIHRQLQELQKEDREVVLTAVTSPFERRPVRALVGKGGVVFDVISAAAFRTIMVGDVLLPVSEIKRRFHTLGPVVKFESGNDGNGICITYRTAGAANAAYNLCKVQKGMAVEVKGQALVCRNKLAEGRAPFQIVVSWRHQGETVRASNEIPVQECFDRVPCVRHLANATKRYQLQEIVSSKQTIPELASTSTLSSFDKHVGEKPSVDIQSEILAPRGKQDNISSEWDTVYCNITKFLNMKLGPEMPELRTQNPMSPDDDMKCFLLFRTNEAAERALDLLSAEENSLHLASLPHGPFERLAVEVFMEGVFCVPQACFVAIEGEFLQKMRLIKQNSPNGGPEYEASAYGNLVVLNLRARGCDEFCVAVNFLNVVLQGEKVPRQQDFLVHPEHVEEVIKAVAHPSDVYQNCKSGEIYLVGDKEAVRNVIEALGNHSKAKEECSTEILDLVFEKFTLLRSFLGSFGDDPRKFAMECGLYHAKFTATFKSIEVFGSIAAIAKAKDLLQNLQAEKLVLPTPESREEACSVCHLPPKGSTRGHVWLRGWHRLANCGHLHCVPCLILAVKWATLPLTCVHKNCASLWVVADVSKVTGDDPDMLTILARRSLQLNIAKEVDVPWRPCPIPECAFVWNTNNSAESQGIQVYGKLHVCPACTNPVCFICQSVFHYGRPCRNEESARSKKGSVATPKPEEIGMEIAESLGSYRKMRKRKNIVEILKPSSALPDKGTATTGLPLKSSEMVGPTVTTAKNTFFPKPEEIVQEIPPLLPALRLTRKRKSTPDIQELSSGVSLEATATQRLVFKSSEFGGPTASTAEHRNCEQEKSYRDLPMPTEPLQETRQKRLIHHRIFSRASEKTSARLTELFLRMMNSGLPDTLATALKPLVPEHQKTRLRSRLIIPDDDCYVVFGDQQQCKQFVTLRTPTAWKTFLSTSDAMCEDEKPYGSERKATA